MSLDMVVILENEKEVIKLFGEWNHAGTRSSCNYNQPVSFARIKFKIAVLTIYVQKFTNCSQQTEYHSGKHVAEWCCSHGKVIAKLSWKWLVCVGKAVCEQHLNTEYPTKHICTTFVAPFHKYNCCMPFQSKRPKYSSSRKHQD